MKYEQDINNLENHMVIYDEEEYYKLYHYIEEPFDEDLED